MNIGEAQDVSVLLRAVQGDVPDPDRLLEAAVRLRTRVHQALDAAPIVEAELCRRGPAAVLHAVAELHREWGETDLEQLDQLAMWERLGAALRSLHSPTKDLTEETR